MTPLPGSGSRNVERLLDAVEQLSPAEQREFQRRLASKQTANGSTDPEEAKLIQAAQARLPAAAERHLQRLIARSERGQLTPQELADYQTLAQVAQSIDAARADALAKLSRLQGGGICRLGEWPPGDNQWHSGRWDNGSCRLFLAPESEKFLDSHARRMLAGAIGVTLHSAVALL